MVTTVFGFFLVPLSVQFGWTRANVSLALAILAVAAAVSYPVAGWLADRYGPRKLILCGNLLFALSIAMLSRLNGSLLQFYGLYALLGIVSSVPSPMLYAKVVSGWFRERRGFLLGLTAGGGNGAGATFMSVVTPIIMLAYGWRGAYVGIGIITAALGFPIFLAFLRDPPAQIPANSAAALIDGETTLSQAARRPTFWAILVAITLGAGCMSAVFSHIVALLTDRRISLSIASSIVTVFALTSACWQITVGYVLDRIPSPKVAAPFFVAGAAGLLLLQYGTTLVSLLASAILMGIALGTEYGVLPYYVARYFGVKSYGTIYGAIFSTVALAVGFTPFLMDAIYDATGSYVRAVYVVAGAMLFGAGLIGALSPYPVQRVGATPAERQASLQNVPQT
jgi:MFS family permease